MSSMDEIKRRIYAVPNDCVIDLLTTYRVTVGAVGAEGYLGKEAKNIPLFDNLLTSAEERMGESRRVKRNIHELVCLTKEQRKWWLVDPREACKVFWRIDKFLRVEKSSGFGVFDKRKIDDYTALGNVADRMLLIMDHLTRGMSSDSISIEVPIERTAADKMLDDFIGDFKFTTNSAKELEEAGAEVKYINPFAKDLIKADIDIHNVFRI